MRRSSRAKTKSHVRSETPYGVQRLHHFTDDRNLPSIWQHGLLSVRERARRGIAGVVTGGNELSRSLDKSYGLDAYVHLSLTEYHPMKFVTAVRERLDRVVDIMVAPQVLERPGIMMTLGVANKDGGRPLLPIAECICDCQLELLYSLMSELSADQQTQVRLMRRYEILVPDVVEPALLYVHPRRTR